VRVALLAMAACFVLNMYVVPASFAAFRQFEFEIRNRVAAFLLQEGVFTTMSDNLMVYVRKRDPDGILHGIFVDDQRDHANPATIIAERGELDPDPNGSPRVVLWNGTRQVLDKRTGRLNILSFTQNAVELTTAGAAEEQRYRDVAEMSMRELLDPPAGIVSARDLPKLAVEAQRRLSAPFTALSFTFVALVAVLRGTFRRHGNIVRPAGAVLAVVGLLALGLAATNLAQRQPLLLPLLWVQAIAPGVVCAAWLLGGLLWPRRLRPLRLPQAEAA
jgi:lipopolysaccharide export system permease protein